MAKNTEKNAKEYNKRARAEYTKRVRDSNKRYEFILNPEQRELVKDIDSPGALAKKLLLDFAQKN